MFPVVPNRAPRGDSHRIPKGPPGGPFALPHRVTRSAEQRGGGRGGKKRKAGGRRQRRRRRGETPRHERVRHFTALSQTYGRNVSHATALWAVLEGSPRRVLHWHGGGTCRRQLDILLAFLALPSHAEHLLSRRCREMAIGKDIPGVRITCRTSGESDSTSTKNIIAKNIHNT